jgi:hypothetical protein
VFARDFDPKTNAGASLEQSDVQFFGPIVIMAGSGGGAGRKYFVDGCKLFRGQLNICGRGIRFQM